MLCRTSHWVLGHLWHSANLWDTDHRCAVEEHLGVRDPEVQLYMAHHGTHSQLKMEELIVIAIHEVET